MLGCNSIDILNGLKPCLNPSHRLHLESGPTGWFSAYTSSGLKTLTRDYREQSYESTFNTKVGTWIDFSSMRGYIAIDALFLVVILAYLEWFYTNHERSEGVFPFPESASQLHNFQPNQTKQQILRLW